MERKIPSKPNKNLGKKILKKLAFMGLAVCMGALTLFGTACTPTQGSQSPQIPTTSEMTTETAGLIYPKAEDPTLYTTESGIEIKYGLSTLDIETSLSTGNLKGFPYFTTTSGGTTYTWVIIGQAEDKPLGTSKPTSFSFSSWTSLSDYYANKKYYNENIKDTTTPAGSAINAVSPSKSYVIDSTNFGDITTNKEIPSGCVLALLNATSLTSYYYEANSVAANKWDVFQDQDIGTYDITYTPNRLRTACYNYGVNDTFGFGSMLSKLQQPTLTGRQYNQTTGTTTYTTSQLKFFPLGGSNYTSENFKWETYLTSAQYKSSVNVWCRSMYNSSSPYYTNTSGAIAYFSSCKTTAYIRPACVISLS